MKHLQRTQQVKTRPHFRKPFPGHKGIWALILFVLAGQLIQAQKAPKVIHSTTDLTYFQEGKKGEKSEWWLDPSLELDVYRMDKVPKSQRISFFTDTDSFQLKLKPGEQYDFQVILNKTDTCRSRIVADAPILTYKNLVPATHDTLPFTLTSGNNIKVKVLLNGTDELDLYFDSGATSLVLTHDAIKEKTQLLDDLEEGYQTQNYHRLPKRSKIKMGNLEWENLTILPVTLAGQETDGHFGWNLFDGRVLEINYDQMILVIHSSLPEIPKGYSKEKIEYINTLFCIQGDLFANNQKFNNRFLFDTGYQKSVLLDSVLMQEQQFPRDLPVLRTNSLRNGEGIVFVTKVVEADGLKLGKITAPKVPSQRLSTGNPAGFKTHILGNELLKRYNTFLDFQGNIVYLAPSKLFTVPYSDS